MAKAENRISAFRGKVDNLLGAIEDAQAEATTIDYLGGALFYRDELNRVTDTGVAIHDITPAQFTAAITALAGIKALLEADNQAIGKALARMRQ